MLAYAEGRFGQRRYAGLLVAWWLVSVIGLAIVSYQQGKSFAASFPLEVWAWVTFVWLLPGFLLGGWKAILVLVGRGSMTRRRDRVFIRLFTFWIVGWAILAYTMTLSGGGKL
jgi:hypothetical protein